MANWNNLPYEIHIIILTMFCRSVIMEFKWNEAKWNQHADIFKEILDDKSYLEWPKTPQPLVDYRSALQTSRYFYNLLSNHIKGIRFGPKQFLIMVQENLIEEMSSRYPKDIRVMYYVAGCFWKNPEIIQHEPYLLRELIESLPPKPRQMLLANAQSLMDQLANRISQINRATEHYRSLCWRWM